MKKGLIPLGTDTINNRLDESYYSLNYGENEDDESTTRKRSNQQLLIKSYFLHKNR